MLKRANRRATIFHTGEDYEAFERVLTESLKRLHLKLFSYCLMPSHWHLLVSPQFDGEMSRFGQWLGLTPTQRYNAHYRTTGEGYNAPRRLLVAGGLRFEMEPTADAAFLNRPTRESYCESRRRSSPHRTTRLSI